MDGTANIRKYSTVIPVSKALLEDPSGWLFDAFVEAMRATPEERLAAEEQARARRAAERADAAYVEPTLAVLADRMGWSPEYVEHLCQPYCTCYDGSDGWETCQHWYDLS